LARDPFSGQLFVLVNRNRKRDKVKILCWERAGLCLWQKRLERERFKWPDHLHGDVLTLDGQQLNWLLDGYNLAAMRPHRSLVLEKLHLLWQARWQIRLYPVHGKARKRSSGKHRRIEGLGCRQRETGLCKRQGDFRQRTTAA
jgi:transposase